MVLLLALRPATAASRSLRLGLSPFAMGMASGRNKFVKGGSNRTEISEEVRDLIKNVRHVENMEEWHRGEGIGEPIVVKPWRPNVFDDIDDDQNIDMSYFPYMGEEIEGHLAPDRVRPLVLLVQRVKTLKGEPWWNKQACDHIGLGRHVPLAKRVAVPNLTYYTSKLFQIKHLVKITPVSFPNGIPDPDEFDPKAAKLSTDGRLFIHPNLRDLNAKLDSAVPDRLAVQTTTYKKEALKHWTMPYNSPLGNSNYNRDTTTFNPELSNFATDAGVKARY